MKLHEIKDNSSNELPEWLTWIKNHWDDWGGVGNILRKFDPDKFHLNGQGLIDVTGPVYLGNRDDMDRKVTPAREIKYPFGKVTGDFEVDPVSMGLVSAKNTPRVVSGVCDLSFADLRTLDGAPTEVGVLRVAHNKLKSLEHCPRVKGGIWAETNKIVSLKDVHKHVKEMNGELNVSHNPITSHLLGCLLINGCTGITVITTIPGNLPKFIAAAKIVNKYFGQGRSGVIAAQQELLDAGLDDYAQI